MNASALIQQATEAGITLLHESDGRLTAEGPSAAIADLWPAIRDCKAEVLDLLTAAESPEVVGLVGYGGLLPTDPNETDPPRRLLSGFYHGLFDGIAEARAYLVLDPDQVRQAVKLGVVSPEIAKANVLVAAKVPGAAGLMAIPRERWDVFDALAIMDGTAIEEVTL
jgi:hypothetical protein